MLKRALIQHRTIQQSPKLAQHRPRPSANQRQNKYLKQYSLSWPAATSTKPRAHFAGPAASRPRHASLMPQANHIDESIHIAVPVLADHLKYPSTAKHRAIQVRQSLNTAQLTQEPALSFAVKYSAVLADHYALLLAQQNLCYPYARNHRSIPASYKYYRQLPQHLTDTHAASAQLRRYPPVLLRVRKDY